MCVYPINWTCSICKKIVSGLSLSFLTSIRNGRGSLQVMIGGLGNLASTENLGGSSSRSINAGGLDFRKTPFCPGILLALENCCWRLAYDSAPVSVALGGSIGRNLISAYCIDSHQHFPWR